MRIRTRVALLLIGLVAIFIAGLFALKTQERARLRAISAERADERRTAFATIRRHWREPLDIFADDFSVWDDLLQATARGDLAWAEANLSETTLASYRAQAVWIYRPDGTRFFSRNTLYSGELEDLPQAATLLPKLRDRGKLWHFFAPSPEGLLEVRGATIHPSRDSGRASPSQGYFFVARRWGAEDLGELSLVSGNRVTLQAPGTPLAPAVEESVVRFTEPLPGWDGRPVAQLEVRNDSPVVRQFQAASAQLFLWLLAFAVALVLALALLLMLWINRPLRRLTAAVVTQRSEPMERLLTQRTEFGDLARLIRDFFAQRETLVREISERRQALEALHASEERLRHAQKMEAVGRLAGGVAHDFNNLLTAILGYSELMLLRLENDDSLRRDVEQIRIAAERAAALTNQLLAFSRKQVLQPRVLDLDGLLRDLEKLLQRVIGEHIALVFETASESARVLADRSQLEQVVLNLCVNARDAMLDGGRLFLRTARERFAAPHLEGATDLPAGEYVTLTVEDSGCGMSAETQARIFEPFFTTKGLGQGTGLGLATVYGIVQQSGGAIAVQSAPGAGTKFTVFLPRVEATVDAIATAPAPVLDGHESGTVLVVEDDLMVRTLVCSVLIRQGFHVLSAGSGQEALSLARGTARAIDLLVTDVVMPQMPGPRLAHDLRATHPETRVLFVSGYSDGELAGTLPPEVHFLQKPFTPAALTTKVRQVLEES